MAILWLPSHEENEDDINTTTWYIFLDTPLPFVNMRSVSGTARKNRGTGAGLSPAWENAFSHAGVLNRPHGIILVIPRGRLKRTARKNRFSRASFLSGLHRKISPFFPSHPLQIFDILSLPFFSLLFSLNHSSPLPLYLISILYHTSSSSPPPSTRRRRPIPCARQGGGVKAAAVSGRRWLLVFVLIVHVVARLPHRPQHGE
jgi:hypothetical protein